MLRVLGILLRGMGLSDRLEEQAEDMHQGLSNIISGVPVNNTSLSCFINVIASPLPVLPSGSCGFGKNKEICIVCMADPSFYTWCGELLTCHCM